MSLHLDVSPQAEARFNSVAQERGIEPEQLFEEMVDQLPVKAAVDATPLSIYERFKDLFGTVEGLPTDLSENPGKYMGDFGHDSGEDQH